MEMNVKRSTFGAAWFGLALALATSTAAAGPSDDELRTRREEGARLHGEGSALYAQGKYDAARAKFHEAYARSQNPNSLFNEAKTTLKGGHALDGAKLVKSYLALPENDKVTAEDRKEAQGLLDEAMASLCTLDVRVATCTVDGRDEAGRVLVEVGNHLVKMNGAQGEHTKSVSCKAREVVIVTYEAEPGPSGPPKERGESGDWLLPATLAGIGAVGVGVGIGLGVASSGARSDAIAAASGNACADLTSPACRSARSDEDTANGLATGGAIAYVTGGALLVAAAVTLFVTTPWKERPARTASRGATARLSPAVGGLWIDGTF